VPVITRLLISVTVLNCSGFLYSCSKSEVVHKNEVFLSQNKICIASLFVHFLMLFFFHQSIGHFLALFVAFSSLAVTLNF